MFSRFIVLVALCGLVLALSSTGLAQAGGRQQSDLSALQRLDVMRSKLDSMHRSLNNAISSMEPKSADKKDKEKIDADDPRASRNVRRPESGRLGLPPGQRQASIDDRDTRLHG